MTNAVVPRAVANTASPGVHVMKRAGEWSVKDAELIRDVLARGLEVDHMRVYAKVCQVTNLDPLKKQIYAWIDKGRLNIHIGINGWRALATRTGDYEGQLGPFFCGPDGAWTDVWLTDEPPVAARVGVYRRGFREPIFHVVRWSEFQRTKARTGAKGDTVWDEKGVHMLGIAAERHSLQRSFPECQDTVSQTIVQTVDMPVVIAERPAEVPEWVFNHDTGTEEASNPETTPEPEPEAPELEFDVEAWYAGLLDACKAAGLKETAPAGFLNVEDTPEAVHAAMQAHGITVEKLVGQLKKG